MFTLEGFNLNCDISRKKAQIYKEIEGVLFFLEMDNALFSIFRADSLME